MTRRTARRWRRPRLRRAPRPCRRFGASARDDPLHGYRGLDRARRARRRLEPGESCFSGTTPSFAASSSRYQGRELDTAGDGFFAAFDGPARAVQAATAIRDALPTLGIEIRAGLHTGECEVHDGKVAGIAVSTGARISSLAPRARCSSRARSRISSPARASVRGSGRAPTQGHPGHLAPLRRRSLTAEASLAWPAFGNVA